MKRATATTFLVCGMLVGIPLVLKSQTVIVAVAFVVAFPARLFVLHFAVQKLFAKLVAYSISQLARLLDTTAATQLAV